VDVTGSGQEMPNGASAPPDLVGSSAIMRGVHERIRLAAGSQAPVFVTGPCGSGKALCARAIHALSTRSDMPFVALNCATLAPDVIASEIFGHLKGGFPGAMTDKPGALALADGGTLFLDEVGALGPGLQAMLLQVLQTGGVRPAGADGSRPVDVRLVCAAKNDLIEAVEAGAFRDDLYYRLHVIPIRMPPLSERGDDVIEIAESVLPRIAIEEGRRFTGLDASARALLPRLNLRGNVRELLNLLRQIVVMNDADLVRADMFPDDLVPAAQPRMTQSVPLLAEIPPMAALVGRSLAEIERLAIEATIAQQEGSITRAARILGVAPSTLYRKMEGWGARPVR